MNRRSTLVLVEVVRNQRKKKELYLKVENFEHTPKQKTTTVPPGLKRPRKEISEDLGKDSESKASGSEPSKSQAEVSSFALESSSSSSVQKVEHPLDFPAHFQTPSLQIPKATVSQGIPEPGSLKPRFDPVISTARSIGNPPEIRISFDYHGALDLGSRRGQECILPPTRAALNRLFELRPDYRVGVCSYIGKSGPVSQQRRASVIEQVFQFRDSFHRDLRLCITSDREKKELNRNTVTAHVDDRLDVCELVRERGVSAIWLNPRFREDQDNRGFVVVKSIEEAIQRVSQIGLVPRSFPDLWPSVFATRISGVRTAER